MIDLRTTRLMARYRLWADQLTFEAVATLPPGEARKERPTPLRSIIGTLNHNYVVDLIWKAHLEGRDHGFTARDVLLHDDLAELWEAQQAVSRWYIDWADWQSARSLAEAVHYRFIGGQPGAMTRGAILMHVVNHATFHRGWIAMTFFQIPAPNPTTDLPVYLRNLSHSLQESPHDQPNPLRGDTDGRVHECHTRR